MDQVTELEKLLDKFLSDDSMGHVPDLRDTDVYRIPKSEYLVKATKADGKSDYKKIDILKTPPKISTINKHPSSYCVLCIPKVNSLCEKNRFDFLNKKPQPSLSSKFSRDSHIPLTRQMPYTSLYDDYGGRLLSEVSSQTEPEASASKQNSVAASRDDVSTVNSKISYESYFETEQEADVAARYYDLGGYGRTAYFDTKNPVIYRATKNNLRKEINSFMTPHLTFESSTDVGLYPYPWSAPGKYGAKAAYADKAIESLRMSYATKANETDMDTTLAPFKSYATKGNETNLDTKLTPPRTYATKANETDTDSRLAPPVNYANKASETDTEMRPAKIPTISKSVQVLQLCLSTSAQTDLMDIGKTIGFLETGPLKPKSSLLNGRSLRHGFFSALDDQRRLRSPTKSVRIDPKFIKPDEERRPIEIKRH